MRDYQRKDNKYVLPTAVYQKTLWHIRDYYRLRRQADEIIRQSKEIDGMPRGGGVSDPTLQAVETRERILADVRVIDRELARIPAEYREAIWKSIQFRQAYPDYAARSTFGLYKSRFIHGVASRLGYTE